MRKAKQEGYIAGAELCSYLKGVVVKRMEPSGKTVEETRSDDQGYWCLSGGNPDDMVSFRCEGYIEKTFTHKKLPKIVRLLEDSLIGYQNKLWFYPGETADVFVHAPDAFTATLYRHGYKKARILDLGDFPRQIQQVPDGFFVETGINWKRSFHYEIPQAAEPGLYSLLIKVEESEQFAIPMIVSTPKDRYGHRSKILVLASTNTWQAYNIWGGRSRYRNFEDKKSDDYHTVNPSVFYQMVNFGVKRIPPSFRKRIKMYTGDPFEHAPCEWYFKRLSIMRPFTNCALEEQTAFQPFTNHLAGGEWRLLAWLEREGIPYDITSGSELHRDPNMLKCYKTIVLSTHCEYWSREMYDGLKYHHEINGLWILNISGNTLYRLIDFDRDDSIRCTDLWLGKSYDDESQLTGVRFTPDDYGSCAPYKIRSSDHWALKNVPVNTECTFGGLSLNQNTLKRSKRYDPGRPGIENGLRGMGASGWETDKRTQTAPNDITVIAKGMNKYGGADMVIREPAGRRGGFFSASSITFGGCLLIDNVASMLVKNVIEKSLDGPRLYQKG